MKVLIYIATICFLFVSCTKKEIIVIDGGLDLNLSVNASFTSFFEKQSVFIEKTKSISDGKSSEPVAGAIITVQQNGNIYSFSQNLPGQYRSDNPFVLESNQTFMVNYQIDTAILKEEILSPAPIIFHQFSSIKNVNEINIQIEIESPINQYFLYKVETLTIDSTFSPNFIDSIWNEKTSNRPFVTAMAKAGKHTMTLPPANSQFFINDEGTAVKIKLTPISKRVADYFNALNVYFETLATYNLYVNPPRFYKNHFHGLTYSTHWVEKAGIL